MVVDDGEQRRDSGRDINNGRGLTVMTGPRLSVQPL
jgi:hypothetical protein